ncbi:uncharacterized protein LOC124872391 isoform X3 [Girardinichthys multiradiatus]|uniref:uncharacterized protein LOC124872391 isoform X3 n=1 Tax=Girardinichthys multiradiatus TaxID=208333 RepID=UPI001FAB5D87|nr:uncharacterized protein LOC124872391 isoform X3 [Girardinichthys multiradiatus]
MQRIVTQLVAGKLQTYMAIVVIFTYGILLRRDFECTCKPQHYDCIIYAVLPALIVIVLMLWSNRLFQKFCSYCCMFKGFLFCQILKSALVGLFWFAFLFIDGNWFACCFNNLSEQQVHLPCKDPGRRTDEEREIIAEMKSTSKMISAERGLISAAPIPSTNLFIKSLHKKTMSFQFSDIMSRRYPISGIINNDQLTNS